MTFDHPISLLLLLLLPALWLWMRATPGGSRVCMALKCLVFAALVIALASPSVLIQGSKLAVTVLMDISASMPRESLQRGETMLRDLVRKKSGADLRLITFAGTPQLWPVPAIAGEVTIPQKVDASDAMATDMEDALQLAVDTFPAQGARRVLLISDGNETQGHALSAALRARQRGVSVFTVPSGGTAPLPVTVESVQSPQDVFSGEHFTLALRLVSALPIPVRVWATSQGQEIGSTTLTLQPGENSANVNARLVQNGVMPVEVHISNAGSEQILFSEAVTVQRPRVLYISGNDKPSAPLLQTMKTAQVDVEMADAFPVTPAKQDWDAVILDNYPNHDLSDDEQSALEKYVYMGGGLIFIAGDKNAHLAREPMTPFEKMLPVRALPPPEKPAAVILVLDKSGSMQGRPMRIVREATRASVLTLRPIDKVGVIAFNQMFDWIIPLGPASELETKADLINDISADGDTNIYQPMLSAFTAITKEEVSSRHIILLTDGDQTRNTFQDFPKLETDAAAAHVTISTIGVGVDVNHPLLDDLAHKTNGKSYFIEDSGLIPQIVNNEVKSVDDLAIQEKPVRALRVRPAEFTDGIDFGKAPRLLGFVQSEAKEGAETILRVDRDKPLLVRWNYGLGSVVAFLSDANGRWSAPWVRWDSFGTLWPQMVRGVARRDQTIRAGVRPGANEDEAIVYFDAVKGTDDQSSQSDVGPPRLVMQTPGGTSQAIALEETVPGHYEAHVPAKQGGLYKIASGGSELALPEIGFYRDADEMKAQAVNGTLLSEISRVTGGRVRPSIDQVLSDRGASISERVPLWPYWLLLALVLNFLELALRKGFFSRISRMIRT